MTTELTRVGMHNASGHGKAATPVLHSVQASGTLDGQLFGLTVRQSYRNTCTDTLEVVYSFPLPLAAVLLALNVEMGGKRLAGVVMAKQAAEQRYEEAMAEGDAPIMLERSGDGLCTVNLGNIKAGEEAVIEYRYAQLLNFEQDQVRLCIPTTIAPRYGNATQGGKLQPQQVPEASLLAHYGLSLTLDLRGAWAQAEVGCVTHTSTMKLVEGGLRLSLGANAWLDRDVVVTLRPQGLPSTAQRADDGEQSVVLASFQPALQGAPRAQVNVKLLVDCSGSMAGDSMASAKLALSQVMAQLRASDSFSFSRFGSSVVHGFRRLAPARAANLAMLQAMIDDTQANLGGTEMQSAMQSTIALPCAADSADVLLITDGEVWDTDDMLKAAAASRHRIFAVGVGAAPAESLLRRLAEATGGACEFATPGESLRAAVDRMFARIRQQPITNVHAQWADATGAAVQPDWTVNLPSAVFAGDTVHVFAGFSGAKPVQARLLADHMGHEQARGEHAVLASSEIAASTADAGDNIARMAAAARLDEAPNEQGKEHGVEHGEAHGKKHDKEQALAWKLALALKYQLVTQYTNFLVVHQRAEGDKALDMAQLHQVPHMLAAGWGGVAVAAAMSAPAGAAGGAGASDGARRGGGAVASGAPGVSFARAIAAPAPSFDFMERSDPAERSRGISLGSRLAAFKLGKAGPAQAETAAPQLEARAEKPAARLDAQAVLQFALSALADNPDVALDMLLDPLHTSADVDTCIAALVASGLDRKTAWAVLIRWLAEQSAQQATTAAEHVVEHAIEDRLSAVSAAQWQSALGALGRLEVPLPT